MFIKNALTYSGTNFISQVALFIQGFVLRRLLPPEIMGVWNYVGVVRNFVSSFTIGLLNGALREIPILKGKGDQKGEVDCRAVTFLYSLFEVSIAAAGVVFYAFMQHGRVSGDEYLALFLAAVLLIFTRLQESYLTFFQGVQLYIPLSRLLFVNSLILAVALPAGAMLLGLKGIFLGALFAEGLKAVWMVFAARYYGIKPGFKWNMGIFKRLASYSVLWKIADYPFSLFMMLDVLWVTHFMGIKPLAIYVFARSFFLQISEITVRFGTVFMTRTFEQYGKKESKEKIAKDMYKFIQFQLLIAVPLLCWIVSIFMPFLIRHLTPNYKESIYLTSILLPASFFDLRNNNLFTIWIAEKRLFSYGKANVFGLTCLLTCFVVSWFILGYKTLASVAWVMVMGYFMAFVYIVLTIGREVLGNRRTFYLLLHVLLTSFWTAGVLIVFGQREGMNLNILSDLLDSAKKAIMMLMLLLPVLIAGVKSSDFMSYFSQNVSALRAKAS